VKFFNIKSTSGIDRMGVGVLVAIVEILVPYVVARVARVRGSAERLNNNVCNNGLMVRYFSWGG
jgi:hypothetical protein